MNECRCGRPTRDAAYYCDDCGDEFSRALGDVPWLVEELETTITKQHAAAASDGGGRTATCSCKDDDDKCQHALIPFHVAASEKRTALRQALVTWIRHCIEDGVRHSSPEADWPADNLVAMSRWLLWRVDGLALNDLGPDAADEITSAVAHCRRVIDRPPERKYAGPCSECKRDLYHRPGATQATCSGCGSTFDVGELYTWMVGQVADQLVTAREGAVLLCKFDLETAQDTIRKWRERGLVVERGHRPVSGDKTARLYLFGDLLDVAARHQKAAS